MAPIRVNPEVTGIRPTRPEANASSTAVVSFEETLRSRVNATAEGVRLSVHAQKRLAERNVSLGDAQQERLTAAVDRINEKGADKSLVLLDDLALVVSARNRVVITALDSRGARENVFTGIESAVIG